MAKIKNKRIYSDDIDFLKKVAADLDFMGKQYSLDEKEGVLVIFAIQKEKKSGKSLMELLNQNKENRK